MKYVIIPNSKDDIEIYKNKGANTFIFGLKGYSINYPELSLEEIKSLSKTVDLFISINKNLFNNELDDIKLILIELSKLPIKGILYYDLGLLNLVLENKIDIDLIWHQTHMVTNYNTCNYYYDKGVKYGFLANEITLEEILEIKEKTNMKLMVEVFGYPIMSHSRRSLLSNYFKSIQKEKENRTYHLEDRENNYLLKETENGASILYGKLINGTKPLFDLIENKIDYGILDMQEVDISTSLKVLDTYQYIYDNIDNITAKEKEEIIDSMNKLIGDSTNFFYKKTIYKVKKEN